MAEYNIQGLLIHSPRYKMHGNHAIVFSHLLLVAMKLLIFFSLVILNKMTNKSDVYTRLTAQMMQYNIHSFLTDRHVLCCAHFDYQ